MRQTLVLKTWPGQELRYATNIRKTMGKASLREVHRAVGVQNRKRAFPNYKIKESWMENRDFEDGWKTTFLKERQPVVDSMGTLEHMLINGRNISQESMLDQILESDVRLFVCALTIRYYLFPLPYNLSALCFQPLPTPHTLYSSQTIWFPECVLLSLTSRPVPMPFSLPVMHSSFSFFQPPPLLSG